MSGLLCTAAENWPDVVWPATRCDQNVEVGDYGTGHVSGGCWKYTNHVFFVVASILGSIVLVAVIIGTFEAKFTEQYKRRAGNRRQRQLEGIIASFAVLDAASSRPCNGLLRANEVLEFFSFCGLDHINLGKLGQGLECNSTYQTMQSCVRRYWRIGPSQSPRGR